MHWQKWPKCLSEHVLQLFSLFTKCAPLNGELLINSQKVQSRAFFVSTPRFSKYKVNIHLSFLLLLCNHPIESQMQMLIKLMD